MLKRLFRPLDRMVGAVGVGTWPLGGGWSWVAALSAEAMPATTKRFLFFARLTLMASTLCFGDVTIAECANPCY
jgi:hypothetical protein